MNIFKRFLCIFFILIFCISFFYQPIYVYAADTSGGGASRYAPKEKETFGEWVDRTGEFHQKLLYFFCCQVGALADKDFVKFYGNSETFKEIISKKNASDLLKFDSSGFTFSKELGEYIKQVLKEYAEKNSGYKIVSTTSIKNINPSSFYDRYGYNTVNALVNKYGYIGVRKGRYKTLGDGYILADMSQFLNGDNGLYLYSDSSSWYFCKALNYTTWEKTISTVYYINNSNLEGSILDTWDEVEKFCSDNNNSMKITTELTEWNYYIYKNVSYFPTSPSNATSVSIISKDGHRVLVFNSQDALINYSVDHRSVYFGSKFYEDTGAVTGSYDDLKDWLDGKYDDLWRRLKDLIPEGSTISEEELEKIIDKLLDQLDEIGDKIDEGNQQTNNLLQQILNALNKLDNTMASALSSITFDTSVIEQYLARILGDLDYISAKLDEITYDEAEEKTDSFLSALTSAFSEIVNVGKTKFPLSLPWDVYNILNIFSGGSESVAAYENFNMEYSADEGIVLFSEDGNRIDADDVLSALDFSDSSPPVSLYGHEETPDNPIRPPGSNSKAPRFEIPFKIVSWGVDETLVIDLYKFEVISQLSRTLLTAYFVFGLIKLTFTVVGFGNEVFK